MASEHRLDGEPTPPVIAPGHTFATVTDKIARDRPRRKPARRSAGSSASPSASCCSGMLGMAAVTWLLLKGIGIWGVNIPVGWGFAIINFVWWIGIGHAGTLISAILLLLQAGVAHVDQPLRRGDDALRGGLRGDVPAVPHRPPVARGYWLFPYPNTMGLWPQFRSPLIWDVFAVSTYATVSAAVLVRRPDPRPGDAARPGEEQVGAG